VWRRWQQNRRKRSKKWHFLYDANFCINQSWQSTSSYGCYGVTLPATKHTTINKHTIRKDNIVKNRKNIVFYYFYDYFWHVALTNCCAQSLPVVMVIWPTQSVGSDNSITYTFYMSPLMARVLGLAHWPWSGPRQLMAGDY
jgi:hypothetical protein